MAASFPKSLKVFSIFHDYTDIIWAAAINEVHDEILALESTLGTNPFTGTPYITFGGAIQDLYANKAPTNHTHVHRNLLNDAQGNDHPQYIMVTGYPGFSHPVVGKAGSAGGDLVPLGQLLGFGYQNAAQVQAMVNAALGNLMAGSLPGPPNHALAGGTATPNWRVTGGVFSGCTGPDGRVTIPFGVNFAHCVQAFSCTKLPPQGSGGCPPYNWIEAQVTLVAASGVDATVQFSHDYSWQPNQWISLSFIVIGN